jgi:hypothetical protein
MRRTRTGRESPDGGQRRPASGASASLRAFVRRGSTSACPPAGNGSFHGGLRVRRRTCNAQRIRLSPPRRAGHRAWWTGCPAGAIAFQDPAPATTAASGDARFEAGTPCPAPQKRCTANASAAPPWGRTPLLSGSVRSTRCTARRRGTGTVRCTSSFFLRKLVLAGGLSAGSEQTVTAATRSPPPAACREHGGRIVRKVDRGSCPRG